MHDDLTRPADLFRKWDRDEDGVIAVDELMAGVRQLGLLPPHASDEAELRQARAVALWEQRARLSRARAQTVEEGARTTVACARAQTVEEGARRTVARAPCLPRPVPLSHQRHL
eukprot:1242275-Prymnesium_polylepis.1